MQVAEGAPSVRIEPPGQAAGLPGSAPPRLWAMRCPPSGLPALANPASPACGQESYLLCGARFFPWRLTCAAGFVRLTPARSSNGDGEGGPWSAAVRHPAPREWRSSGCSAVVGKVVSPPSCLPRPRKWLVSPFAARASALRRRQWWMSSKCQAARRTDGRYAVPAGSCGVGTAEVPGRPGSGERAASFAAALDVRCR